MVSGCNLPSDGTWNPETVETDITKLMKRLAMIDDLMEAGVYEGPRCQERLKCGDYTGVRCR